MKKNIAFLCFMAFINIHAFSQAGHQTGNRSHDSAKGWNLMPILSYEYLSFDEQHIHSPGEGLMFTKGNTNPSLLEEHNSLTVMGMFKQYFIKDEYGGYPDLYHSITAMLEKKTRKHLFIGALIGESDKPFYGGLRSFTVAAGYGYELIRKENLSLTLGIGAAVGDMGIELPNGAPLSVMPIPIARFNAGTSWVNLSLEFLGMPNLNLTLFPENRIRLINKFRVSRFRDIRDFVFDVTLMYRFFSGDSRMGDFAGIGVGVKNDKFGFKLEEKDKEYEMIYNSVYGVLDFAFMQVYGGYSFNGIEIYDDDTRRDIGKGFFVNAMLAWRF